MADNNVQAYIKDLLEENKRFFAMNSSIVERRKELKKELLKVCDGTGADSDIKKSAELIGRLLGLAYLYRLNMNDIKNNLKTIEDLRNGIIKEI